MPLVSTRPILAKAREEGYALGAFNPVDYNSMRAIIGAAEELEAPVIVQVSVKTVKYWGHEPIRRWMEELAGPSPVPVAFHLDHCKDVDFIRRCIEHGWTSVMFDGSEMPVEENLARTREVLAMAEGGDVGVEAELGRIVGVEEEIAVSDREASLADPDTAVRFCEGLQLAAFAPAIGTAHGVYKGEPEIAFDRLEVIATRTGLPIALHGGTGLSDAVFRRCIRLGCAKVNISTQLKYACIDGFCDYHRENPDDYEPLRVIDAQYRRMKGEIAKKIEAFGGAGRASA